MAESSMKISASVFSVVARIRWNRVDILNAESEWIDMAKSMTVFRWNCSIISAIDGKTSLLLLVYCAWSEYPSPLSLLTVEVVRVFELISSELFNKRGWSEHYDVFLICADETEILLKRFFKWK